MLLVGINKCRIDTRAAQGYRVRVYSEKERSPICGTDTSCRPVHFVHDLPIPSVW